VLFPKPAHLLEIDCITFGFYQELRWTEKRRRSELLVPKNQKEVYAYVRDV
jgi:hypothetical protein